MILHKQIIGKFKYLILMFCFYNIKKHLIKRKIQANNILQIVCYLNKYYAENGNEELRDNFRRHRMEH